MCESALILPLLSLLRLSARAPDTAVSAVPLLDSITDLSFWRITEAVPAQSMVGAMFEIISLLTDTYEWDTRMIRCGLILCEQRAAEDLA
jgi:hypothetical protein